MGAARACARPRAWRHANRRIAETYGEVAKRADNRARETVSGLVAEHDVIVLEDLDLTAMTRSARGQTDNADNAADDIAQLRARAEAAWRTAGRPSLERTKHLSTGPYQVTPR